MVPYPVAQVETGTGLVATLGRQIQAHVRTDQFFVSTTVGLIGMENVAGPSLMLGRREQHDFSNTPLGTAISKWRSECPCAIHFGCWRRIGIIDLR
jgi:hypothetical protein